MIKRKARKNLCKIGRIGVASSPVDHDNADMSGSTDTGRPPAGTLLTTLRRERLTRCRLLEKIEGDGPYAQIPLDKFEIVIGRAPSAHIRLASKKACPRHAFLRIRGTDCVMTDNDSRNGVLLNGVQVHSAVLHDGDVIAIADNVFVYREVSCPLS